MAVHIPPQPIEDQQPLEDRLLVCTSCSREFVFEVGEQVYFHDKGFPDPKRCPECRRARRERLEFRDAQQRR